MVANGRRLQLGTEECCFIGNAVAKDEGELELALNRHSFDLFLGGLTVYQSYNDRFLNHQNMSLFVNDSASVEFIQSLFVAAGSAAFFAGHFCNRPPFPAAFSSFTLPSNLLKELTIVWTSPPSRVGSGEAVNDVTVPDNTQWATRVPPATPVGRITPTDYTLGTNLSVSSAAVHTIPTASSLPFTRSSAFSASRTFTASKSPTPHPTRSPLPEEKTISISEVATIVRSETVTLSLVQDTLLSYEDSVSIILSYSVDANNNTVSFTETTIIAVLTVIQSARYVPIVLPVFVTTMSRVEFQLARYQTAEPDTVDNATLIGAVTGGAFIAAVMVSVVLAIMRKKGEEEVSGFDEDDGPSVRATRRRDALNEEDEEMDSELSDDESSSSEGSDGPRRRKRRPNQIAESRYLRQFMVGLSDDGAAEFAGGDGGTAEGNEGEGEEMDAELGPERMAEMDLGAAADGPMGPAGQLQVSALEEIPNEPAFDLWA
jgi:hypothetical protein